MPAAPAFCHPERSVTESKDLGEGTPPPTSKLRKGEVIHAEPIALVKNGLIESQELYKQRFLSSSL